MEEVKVFSDPLRGEYMEDRLPGYQSGSIGLLQDAASGREWEGKLLRTLHLLPSSLLLMVKLLEPAVRDPR
jgi:hypothetical protein